MCMFGGSSDTKDPVAPAETAQMRNPDNGVVMDAHSRRIKDQQRASANTVLTSGSGVTDRATTQKKTLLGA